MTGSLLDVLTGWTLYSGLVAVLGGCIGHAFIVPRASVASPEAPLHLESVSARMGFGGALLLLPAMALFFLRQLVEFRDPFVPWIEDAELLLTGTAWGATWLRGLAGSAVLVIALGLAARGKSVGWWLGGLVAVALTTFPAFMGHANTAGPLRPLTLGADVLHLWAAGGWMGGLMFVLVSEHRWRGGDSLLPSLVPVFSRLAVVCVAALAVTGTLSAWAHLPDLGALVNSRYGVTLLAKLAFVFAALGLGFLNWRFFTPELDRGNRLGAIRRAATIELIIAQVVLVATALLVRTSPPMG